MDSAKNEVHTREPFFRFHCAPLPVASVGAVPAEGLQLPDPAKPLPPIEEDEIQLVAWMAVAPTRSTPSPLLSISIGDDDGRKCLLAVQFVEPFAVAGNHVSSRPSCGAIVRIAGDMT